ncbi:MAG TPA: hypothetical protein DEP10_07590 [Alphaproteobacteria bacterium]|jgi:hypothetical protein|nr:hypothetical protein [Alphaproteobacteria bacterium]
MKQQKADRKAAALDRQNQPAGYPAFRLIWNKAEQKYFRFFRGFSLNRQMRSIEMRIYFFCYCSNAFNLCQSCYVQFVLSVFAVIQTGINLRWQPFRTGRNKTNQNRYA